MADKDFLSQFSNVNKPDSFKEEVRTKVIKEKKPVNKLAIIIVLAVLIVVSIIGYFVFLAPKIEMPNFVGKTKSDVAAWVKQQQIDSTGIVFGEEYNFDNDENVILTQDVEAGSKVKENVKLTFTISKGADPDELIKVPDIESMDKTELKKWIDSNKLTKTKITTAYSDTIETDQVISFTFTACDEDSFTRSSNLKIVVSKGQEPAGTITVEDFSNSTIDTVETWAKKNKITLTKSEAYSDNVLSGLVISQSVAAKKTMKAGDTLSVVVSKGKGIMLPDFTKMSKSEYEKWKTTNSDFTYITMPDDKAMYSYSDNYILKQSVKAGTMVGLTDKVILTENLGDGFYLETEGITLSGSADVIDDWSYTASERGLSVTVNYIKEKSSKDKGTILSYDIKADGVHYSKIERLPLTVKIILTVSDGEGMFVAENYVGKGYADTNTKLTAAGMVVEKNEKYNSAAKGNIIEQSVTPTSELKVGSTITLTVSKGGTFKLSDYVNKNQIVGKSYQEVVDLVNTLNKQNPGLAITVQEIVSPSGTVQSFTIGGEAYDSEVSINSTIVLTLG